MRIKLLVGIFLTLLVSLTYATPPKPRFSSQPITEHLLLPKFNQVKIEGNINVFLKTGFAKPGVVLRGISKGPNLSLNVDKKGLLFIRVQGNTSKNATIEVQAQYLNYFGFSGKGAVKATHLKSSLLDLFIENSGQTELNGSINLQNLEAKGPGLIVINGVHAQNLSVAMVGNPRIKISGVINAPTLNVQGKGSLELYWIKSTNLRIRMKDNVYLQLAGIVNRLDVELWDNAHFNGRYLRAKRSFTRTHDHALAEITTLDRQHTMATDASDIYFYKIPTMKAGFMSFNGAILDMRDWSNTELHDYTRYNK